MDRDVQSSYHTGILEQKFLKDGCQGQGKRILLAPFFT